MAWSTERDLSFEKSIFIFSAFLYPFQWKKSHFSNFLFPIPNFIKNFAQLLIIVVVLASIAQRTLPGKRPKNRIRSPESQNTEIHSSENQNTEDDLPIPKPRKAQIPHTKTPKWPKHRKCRKTWMWNNGNQLSSYPCSDMHMNQPYLKLDLFSFSWCEVVTVCSLCNSI